MSWVSVIGWRQYKERIDGMNEKGACGEDGEACQVHDMVTCTLWYASSHNVMIIREKKYVIIEKQKDRGGS